MEPNRPQTTAEKQKTIGNVKKGGAALIIAMIASTIAVEGGWVNNPNDPGGETNYGVTKKVAVQYGYRGPMRTLPKATAESIHYQGYIVKPGYEPLVDINAPVVEELYDTAVNMGPTRPSRWFQQIINDVCRKSLPTNGVVDATTIEAFSTCQIPMGAEKMCLTFLDRLDAKQLDEYGRLVRNNPKLKVFYRGWKNNRIGNVPRSHCKVVS